MHLGGDILWKTSIVEVVNDPTSRYRSDAGQNPAVSPPGVLAGTLVDRDVIRRLLATADASDDPTFRALIEELCGENKTVESLLDSALSDPDRLAVVHATGLLEGRPNPALDRLVALTAEAIGTPSAAVSIVSNDRQVLAGLTNAAKGVNRSAPIEESICKYAVASGQPLIVDDATIHPLLANHPKVLDGTVRSYAGILLADGQGNIIGTLCAWDGHPRRWTSGQLQILKDLAEVVRSKVFIDLPTDSHRAPPARPSFQRRRRS